MSDHHVRRIAALLPLAAALVAAQQPAASGSDPALSVARSLAPREQMHDLVLRALNGTTTAAIIARKLGPMRTAALFEAEDRKVVARYGEEWTGLLAGAYRDSLNPEELTAAAKAADRHDRAAIEPYMARAAPVMQRAATPLLVKASTEALTAAYQQMMAEPAR